MRTSFDDIRQRLKEHRLEAAAKGRQPSGGTDLHKLISALPAPIYATDAAGRITYYNAAAAQLWGCEPEHGTSTFCGSRKL